MNWDTKESHFYRRDSMIRSDKYYLHLVYAKDTNHYELTVTNNKGVILRQIPKQYLSVYVARQAIIRLYLRFKKAVKPRSVTWTHEIGFYQARQDGYILNVKESTTIEAYDIEVTTPHGLAIIHSQAKYVSTEGAKQAAVRYYAKLRRN